MAKESTYSIEPNRCIFRETFDSEQGVRSRGGVPSNVAFNNGVGVFNGTSSYNLYKIPLNGIYSVRIVFKNYTLKMDSYYMDCRVRGVGLGHIREAASSDVSASSGTVYVNSIQTIALTSSTKEVVVSGITIKAQRLNIGSVYIFYFGWLSASVELFEIYSGTLSAYEIANLYNNKRQKPVLLDNLTRQTILNVDAFNGVVQNRLSGNIINGVTVPPIVNTSVSIVKDQGLNVANFIGHPTLANLNCGSYFDGRGDVSVVVWVKWVYKNKTPYNDQYILYNGKFALEILTNTGIIKFSSNDSTYISTSSSITFNKYSLICVTRTSTGIANIYLNGILDGSANQNSGTPANATINMFIGSDGNAKTIKANIGSVRVINGLLTAQEISEIFSSEKGKYGI